MKQQDYILQLRNIHLRFGNHHALNNVSLGFTKGKIHGLFGKNGAGKSVMINMLAGLYHPDSGQIWLEGKPVSFSKPVSAMKAGIGSVLQADTLVENISIGENLMMQEYALSGKKTLFSGVKKQRIACQKIMDQLGIQAQYTQRLDTVNYGTKQMVKLARTLCSLRRYKVLLMDEPCSGCSYREELRFYDLLQDLREKGYTVIVSSHHIEQMLPYCDTVTVIDNGQVIMHCPADQTDYSSILRVLSHGNLPQTSYPTIPQAKQRVILNVQDISTERIDHVSFTLRKGEILGITGLLGSGRTGIARAIAGLDPLLSGEITFNGEPFPASRKACHPQVAFLPADHVAFVVPEFTVPPNITMSNLNMIQTAGLLNPNKEIRIGCHYTRTLNIKEQQNTHVEFLSAGNQKKVMLSRMFFKNSNILILDDPTENIDILSKNEIYNQLNSYVLQGNAVIFISSDIQELNHMCSRILITKNRTVVKEVPPFQLTYEDLFL